MVIMRQVIVGKFGLGDVGVVEASSSSTVTEIDFLNKKHQLKFGVGEYLSDMIKMGVLDPVKVTRHALQNAASVASMVLTTECLVTDVPDKKKELPSMSPDMGMM